MPKRSGLLQRRHSRSPIDHCESALPPTDPVTLPRRALTRSSGTDWDDEFADSTSLFLNQHRTVVAERAPSIPPIDTFGSLGPSIEQSSPHRSNPALERTNPIGLGIHINGLDVNYLLADHSSPENEDLEACALQQPALGHIAEATDIQSVASDVFSASRISDDAPVPPTVSPRSSSLSLQETQSTLIGTPAESTQSPTQHALDGASSPQQIEPPQYDQLTPRLGHPNVAANRSSNGTVIQSSPLTLPVSNPARAACATARQRNRRSTIIKNVGYILVWIIILLLYAGVLMGVAVGICYAGYYFVSQM